MATTAAPARAGASEATIMFHNEPWTAEVARLLLEVDEGWVGYRGDAAWSWHDETYAAFVAVCGERQWPANSRGACMAMLHALRTGAISMKLSSATRSSDGCAQWSLVEMRELGAQMRRVVDGKVPTARWAAQLLIFVDAMKGKDASYSIEDRAIEEFAVRAGKFLPEPILRFIDPNGDNGRTPQPAVASNGDARRTPTPEPQSTATTTASAGSAVAPVAAPASTRNPQRTPTPEPEERQTRAPTTAKNAGNAEQPAPAANARKAQRTPTPEPEKRQKRAPAMATKDTANAAVANAGRAQRAPTPEPEDRHKKAASQNKQTATATKEIDSDDEPLAALASINKARRTPMPSPTPTPEIEERPKKAPTTTATKDAGNDEPPAAMANSRKAQRAPTPEPEERQKKSASQKRQTATKDDGSDDEPLVPAANTRKTRRTAAPEDTRRVTRGQSVTRATRDEDSEDEPLVPRRSTRSRSRNESDNELRRHTRSQAATSMTQIKKRGRKRSVESEGDSSYHDPTSEEDGDAFWDAALQLSETEDDIVATQELTSQGELLPAEQPTPPTQATVNESRPSQDEPHAERPSSASSQVRTSSQDPPVEAQPSPRQDPPVEQPASPHEDPQVEERPSPRENPRAEQQASPRQDPERESPRESNQGQKRRQDSADQTRTVNGSQRSDSPTRQPSRKYRRVQNNERVHSNGRASSSSSSSLFRSLNPHDRPGKPWGEFVVEVLLAERTARNEDELDYVQFVRGLYEI